MAHNNLTPEQQENLDSKKAMLDSIHLALAAYGGGDKQFIDERTKEVLNRFLDNNDKDQAALYDQMLKGDGFSSVESERFRNTYTMLDHQTNMKSGYAGTFYRHNITGDIIYASRGTEPVSDFWADLVSADAGGIVLSGNAIHQNIDAANHYQRVAGAMGEPVVQHELKKPTFTDYVYKGMRRASPVALIEDSARASTRLAEELIATKSNTPIALPKGTEIIEGKSATGLGLIPEEAKLSVHAHSLGRNPGLTVAMVARAEGINSINYNLTY